MIDIYRLIELANSENESELVTTVMIRWNSNPLRGKNQVSSEGRPGGNSTLKLHSLLTPLDDSLDKETRRLSRQPPGGRTRPSRSSNEKKKKK